MVSPIATVHDIKNMSYAPNEGMEQLVEMTKEVILQTLDLKYPYVLITNGATQAINSILKYYRAIDYRTVCTTRYGYPFYKDMIRNIGMERYPKLQRPPSQFSYLYLIDSPSNPEGIQSGSMRDGLSLSQAPVIWDAVYHNKIYAEDLNMWPQHDIMVGSYSKLLGVTGARVGYVATHSKVLFDKISDFSYKDVATISIPSQKLIMSILENLHLDFFMKQGNTRLNYNRERFQKLEYLFDNQPVKEVGMFYCAHADQKAIQLLEKCGIKYIDLGDNYIRLSMGQTLDITSEAVKLILKEDKVGKK